MKFFISRGVATKLPPACHHPLCRPQRSPKPFLAHQRSRVWCSTVPVGLARRLRGALGAQAAILPRCCATLRPRHSVYHVQCTSFSFFLGPRRDPAGTPQRRGPQAPCIRASASERSHAPSCAPWAPCLDLASDPSMGAWPRAAPAACWATPRGRLASVRLPCGPGSRPGLAQVPLGSRTGAP